MDSEWIEHHGKGYPDLPLDTLVQVRFADGEVSSYDGSVKYWSVCWRHEEDEPHWADIMAYRVVKSDA